MSLATISDVAKKAGVGISTVSRVMNNAPLVKEETARTVRRAVEELGYAPAVGGSRRGPRPGAVDSKVLLASCYSLRWVLDCAPVYAYVLAGIEAALNQRGQNLVVRQTTNWDDFSKVIKKDKARGVILFGREPEGDLPPVLDQIAAVWVMGSPRQFQGDHISQDDVRIGAMAAQHALKLGHRHGAYLGSATGLLRGHLDYRADSFKWNMEQAGASALMLVDPAITIMAKGMNAPNEPLLGAMMDRLAAASPRPTVLMLQADMYAPSVYRHLLDRGIDPGKDITIMTCNNERPYLVGLRPAPVIIDTHGDTIGRRAVDQLMWRMENPNEQAMRLLVEPELILPE